MPSPLILARKSGLYCRFLIPADLRAAFGQRFVVRALHAHDRDEARLQAALLAIELSAVFSAARKGTGMDVKQLLANIDPDKVRDFGAKKITFPNGTVIEDVQINSDDDLKRFNAFSATQSTPAATNTAAPQIKPQPNHPPEHAVLLSKRMETFLNNLKVGKRSEKIQDEYLNSLQLLIECCNDKPPADYTVENADAFEDVIQSLPPNRTKRKEFEGLTAPDAAKWNTIKQGKVIGTRTMEKHVERVRAFFYWCIKRRYMPNENNFAGRQLRSKKQQAETTRLPFTTEDIARIFSPEVFTSRMTPHLYWGTLLALFTGARINEIAQLYLADIVQDGEHYGIVVNDIRENQRIKNDYSRRAIPLHPKLIELGFMDYVAAVEKHGFARIFPMLPWSETNGYGDALGDTFHRSFLRSKPATPAPSGKESKNPPKRKSAPRVGIDDPAKTFHSFRHRFCNELYQKVADSNHIKELSGHERPGVFHKTYAPKLEFAAKIPIINLLPLPVLAIEPYPAERADNYLAKLKKTHKMNEANAKAKAQREAGKDPTAQEE